MWLMHSMVSRFGGSYVTVSLHWIAFVFHQVGLTGLLQSHSGDGESSPFWSKDVGWISWLKLWFKDSQVILLNSEFRLTDLHYKIRFWFSDMDIPRSLHLWDGDIDLIVNTW